MKFEQWWNTFFPNNDRAWAEKAWQSAIESDLPPSSEWYAEERNRLIEEVQALRAEQRARIRKRDSGDKKEAERGC